MKYAQIFNKKKTPQTMPILGSGQVRNSAKGYVWAVDCWTMLERFLILGSENGTYYIGERKLTLEHADNVLVAIQQDGPRAVDQIVKISQSGRAPKADPAIFALALAASFGDDKTRLLALEAVPAVCRTGTHLFTFAEAADGLRGWGRGLRKAIGRWYNVKSPIELELQLVKYGQRGGWSHRDLLRLAHPVPSSDSHKGLYAWATGKAGTGSAPGPLIEVVQRLKGETSPSKAAEMIRASRVPREAVPTELLTEKVIWEALLEQMPMTAMIRNLGNMSKCELLVNGSSAADKVIEVLGDVERLRKARVHPIQLLAALTTYQSGAGVRGSGQWTPVASVIDALDKAFYSAFDNVESTGKRYLLGLDVSGSMAGTRVTGLAALDCRQACGAMALATLAAERNVQCVAFDTVDYPLALSARQRLDDVVNVLAKTGGGGTNCALPIEYATRRKLPVDMFVIYTDSETWQGNQHPSQAMEAYRKATGIDAKLAVVAMASNQFTVGDTRDPLTLNIVGFDTTVPAVLAEFAK